MRFNEAKARAVATFDSPIFRKRIKEEDATMLSQLTVLQEINRNGFITVESQAGTNRKGVRDGHRFEMLERAYVIGFMLETDAARFILHMSLNTDKNAIFVPVFGDANLPAALDIPLTITNRQHVETHFSSALPTSVFESLLRSVHLNTTEKVTTEKVVCIFCWDTVWGRKGLFKDVLRVLRP